jgi:ribosomal-protein-alanine N-acetyltransferase
MEIASLLSSGATVGSAALDPATGRLRGFAISRLAADEAEVLTIAVDLAYRGRGVGRDLMREHLARATLAGARTIFLEVDAENAAALALYARFRFVEVGRRVGYYRRPDGKAATALVMRRALK